MCGCIFRSVCGVRREKMQDKKVIADYFGFTHTKRGIARFTAWALEPRVHCGPRDCRGPKQTAL